MTKISYKQKREDFSMRTAQAAPMDKYKKVLAFTKCLTMPHIAFQDFTKEKISNDELVHDIQIKAIALLQEIGESE